MSREVRRWEWVVPPSGQAPPETIACASPGDPPCVDLAAPRPIAERDVNRLIFGDNLEVMRRLAAAPSERFHLIYLDPPFGTGKAFAERVRRGGAFRPEPAYRDRWPDVDSYLAWLVPRLEAARDLLCPHGSLVVHLDWRAVHHVKVALDRIFGAERFINEIVWLYNGGAVPARAFSRKHDTLLWYANGPDYTFRQLRRPYKANTRAVGRHSTYAREVRIDLERGTPLTDWWDDIPTETGWAREVAYPTAKPKALLERLLRALTNPGDRVADFFAGSGTLAVACERLAEAAGDGAGPRGWTLCDCSPAAWRAMLARLRRRGRWPYRVEWAVPPSAGAPPLAVERVDGATHELRLTAPDRVESWAIGVGNSHSFHVAWSSDRGVSHRREGLTPVVRARLPAGDGRLVVRILAVDGRWWWIVKK